MNFGGIACALLNLEDQRACILVLSGGEMHNEYEVRKIL